MFWVILSAYYTCFLQAKRKYLRIGLSNRLPALIDWAKIYQGWAINAVKTPDLYKKGLQIIYTEALIALLMQQSILEY